MKKTFFLLTLASVIVCPAYGMGRVQAWPERYIAGAKSSWVLTNQLLSDLRDLPEIQTEIRKLKDVAACEEFVTLLIDINESWDGKAIVFSGEILYVTCGAGHMRLPDVKFCTGGFIEKWQKYVKIINIFPHTPLFSTNLDNFIFEVEDQRTKCEAKYSSEHGNKLTQLSCRMRLTAEELITSICDTRTTCSDCLYSYS